jgi:hypothetical protein
MKEERLQLNQITDTFVLSTSANLVALSLGRKIYTEIDELSLKWDIEMKNSLVNMYLKCGNMDDTWRY